MKRILMLTLQWRLLKPVWDVWPRAGFQAGRVTFWRTWQA